MQNRESMPWESKSFKSLIALATEGLKTRGFEPLDEGGGERHGAWEWTWAKREGKRGSYASLVGFEAVEGTYKMQVWAGADNGVHFGRYLIREFPNFPAAYLPCGDININLILESLENAAQRASHLSEATLTGNYVPQIPTPPPTPTE